MQIMSGTNVRKEFLVNYEKKIRDEDLDITLAIIQLGDKEESIRYVRSIIKYVSEVGIKTKLIKLSENTSEEELLKIIYGLNEDSTITGILLQSPTPEEVDFTKCVREIKNEKDVDGFSKENLFGIRDNREKILPCTVKGILKLLEYYDIDVEGKNTVIIGKSNIVGRPLADAFINRNATVTVCHSKTKNLEEYTKRADILVSAVGKPNLVTKDMVKEGFVGIDVGINYVDGKIVGDFSNDIYDKASFITPVPGGVGPMTVAMIMDNLIELKEKQKV